MKKFIIGLFLVMIIGVLASTNVSASETMMMRHQLYNFVLNHEGSTEDIQQDLRYMCENAEVRPYYQAEYEVTGYRGGTSTWSGKSISTCKMKRTYIRNGYTYVVGTSLWYLNWIDTDEGRKIYMWGCRPGRCGSSLKAYLPLLQ